MRWSEWITFGNELTLQITVLVIRNLDQLMAKMIVNTTKWLLRWYLEYLRRKEYVFLIIRTIWRSITSSKQTNLIELCIPYTMILISVNACTWDSDDVYKNLVNYDNIWQQWYCLRVHTSNGSGDSYYPDFVRQDRFIEEIIPRRNYSRCFLRPSCSPSSLPLNK